MSIAEKTTAEALLTAYQEIRLDLTEDNVIHMINIHSAFHNADLTELEKTLLKLRYFEEPSPPERDKKDKNGGTNGRPPGGTTDGTIACLIWPNVSKEAAKGKFKRIKASALKKMEQQLGEDYFVS